MAGSFVIRQSKKEFNFSLQCVGQRDRIRRVIQVKMFFNEDYEKLEQTARSWLDGSDGLISEVLNISQCECINPKTNQRGVLLTILYREKKGARGQDSRQII